MGLVLLAILSVGLAGGCSPAAQGSWESKHSSVNNGNGEQVSYTVEELRHDDRVYVLLAGPGTRGWRSSSRGGRHEGVWRMRDGSEIRWSCTTTDGRTGKLVFGNRTFNLAHGGLFLLPPGAANQGLKQHDVDLSQLAADQQGMDHLKQLAENAVVAQFLESLEADARQKSP